MTAGIGWAVLNRDASYVPELRQTSKAPVFSVSSDPHRDWPHPGPPVWCPAAYGRNRFVCATSVGEFRRERTHVGHAGSQRSNIHLIMLKAQWTEESAQRSVRSWLKLTTSQKANVDLIAAQDDSMAIGARKAFQELSSEIERERWLSLPFLGCDGLPNTGQSWVRSGLLTATIYIPPNSGQAMEMLVDALQHGKAQPERALTNAISVPPLDALRPRK